MPKNQYFTIDFETTGLFDEDPTTIPIEVGICALHPDTFEIVGEYQSLIAPSGGVSFYLHTERLDAFATGYGWLERYKQAANVHKISPTDWALCETNFPRAAQDLRAFVAKHSGGRAAKNCVLLSDNAHFEMQCLKVLLGGAKSPFHYACRDTVFAQDLLGLYKKNFFEVGEDPHRALPDARALARVAKAIHERVGHA